MADINLQLVAAHQAPRDTRQTAQRSPVPRIAHEPAAGTPPRPDTPAYTTAKPVAFDLLLAVQQARAPEKVRAFDVREAYGDKPQGGTRNQTSWNESAPPASGVFVDQTSTDAPAGAAQTSTAAWQDGVQDNAAPLFVSGHDDDTTDTAPRPQDVLSQRANRAYVNAGAFDGRTFATAGLDSRLDAGAQGFDLLI